MVDAYKGLRERRFAEMLVSDDAGPASVVGRMYGRIKEFFYDMEMRYWKRWMEKEGLLPGSEQPPRKYTLILKID